MSSGKKLAAARFHAVLLGVGLISLGAAVQPVYAAPDSGVRVGFVDLRKAVESSKAGQEANKKYEAQVKKAQSGLESKRAELERLRENYKKQQATLNDKAKQDKEEEILTMDKELKRSLQDSQEKLRRENNVLVNDLVKKIMAVVSEVGKQEGFTVILERGSNSVLFADSKIDITDTVVKRFDASSTQ